MKIRDFGVEMWMAKYENEAIYNIAETCVASITVDELLEMADMKAEAFEKISQMKIIIVKLMKIFKYFIY